MGVQTHDWLISNQTSYQLCLLSELPTVAFVWATKCAFCLSYQVCLLSELPIVPFVWATNCAFCLSYQLCLLSELPTVPFVWVTNCAFCLSYQLCLLSELPTVPFVCATVTVTLGNRHYNRYINVLCFNPRGVKSCSWSAVILSLINLVTR